MKIATALLQTLAFQACSGVVRSAESSAQAQAYATATNTVQQGLDLPAPDEHVPAIPPYFGGSEGHALREAAVAAWVAENSTYYQQLSAIMDTELYRTAAKYCQTYIDEYNELSATMLYVEGQARPPPAVTYQEFWGLGGSVFDGAYDFASQFLYFANFTSLGSRVTCIADCYCAEGGGDCSDLAPYYPNIGTVSPQTFCSLQWDLIDQGFTKLKICGAMAIGGSPTLDRAEMVRVFKLDSFEQRACSMDYCKPASPEEACPAEVGGAEKLYEEYQDVARVDGSVCGYAAPNTSSGGLSPGAVAGIVLGIVAATCLALSAYYLRRLKDQRTRYKKRLVQNVARNVSIAPSPGGLSADKLAKEFNHIDANGDGSIGKSEMRNWLQDGKLGEISDSDFDAMWDAMSGKDDRVNAIEFFVFLSGCGDAFDEVYKEQSAMTKEQKIALASRRLSSVVARNGGMTLTSP